MQIKTPQYITGHCAIFFVLRTTRLMMGILTLAVAFFFISTTVAATPYASDHLRVRPPNPLPINILRPSEGSGGHPIRSVSCQSWRLGVETNNVRDWLTVPSSCENYIGNYMLGDRYRQDSIVVTAEATAYAESLKLKGDGMDIWIFDIDETTLSNLPYYATHGFRAEEYNSALFHAWAAEAAAPRLPESLKLYNKLLTLGIKPVFLTGRHEKQRNSTADNLIKAGYHSWEKFLLKGEAVEHTTAVAFKSGERQKLVDQGYKIVGNMGDQWSDLLGTPEGDRTFKVPDPMYYIS